MECKRCYGEATDTDVHLLLARLHETHTKTIQIAKKLSILSSLNLVRSPLIDDNSIILILSKDL